MLFVVNSLYFTFFFLFFFYRYRYISPSPVFTLLIFFSLYTNRSIRQINQQEKKRKQGHRVYAARKKKKMSFQSQYNYTQSTHNYPNNIRQWSSFQFNSSKEIQNLCLDVFQQAHYPTGMLSISWILPFRIIYHTLYWSKWDLKHCAHEMKKRSIDIKYIRISVKTNKNKTKKNRAPWHV